MSQEKVEKYKEEKKNRKAIMKKAKIHATIRTSIAVVVLVAIVGWIGYSAVDYYYRTLPRAVAEVDYTSLSEYEDTLLGVE